jgi:hypothetical protein
MSTPSELMETKTTSNGIVEVDETREALEGYVLDLSRYPNNAAGLKTTSDGQYALIPQPLDTPLDPLNWPRRKKAITLAVLTYVALLADYTGGTAIGMMNLQ